MTFLKTKFLLLSSALIFLSGCATVYRAYPGKPLPAEKIAKLDSADINTQIHFVDGIAPFYILNGKSAELLPGKHTIGAGYTAMAFNGDALVGKDEFLEFNAQANHLYLLKSLTIDSHWFAFIVDYQTQKIVSKTIKDPVPKSFSKSFHEFLNEE